ncbi:MAG TPA: TetR/AcrR family transcriptional regulator [Acidimicrobiales bacterium]|nr:TetR/AcrR family transcriptional regulator [Acidimicrobiales bacterium]
MARRQPKVRDTRERVAAAALEVFSEKGYAGTSIDDIVERAGTTRGAFYYYFEGKEDVARDLQRDLWHRLAADAQDAFDPALDTVTNLKRAFGVLLSGLDDLGTARFFLREGWVDPFLEAAGRGEQDWGTELVRALLATAMAQGEVKPVDADALAAVITGMFEEATLHVLRTGRAEPTIEVVHQLLDGLRTPEAASRSAAALAAHSA